MSKTEPVSDFQQDFTHSVTDTLLWAMAKEYHARCEAYDRTVCTKRRKSGPDKGEAIPANGREFALMMRNAIATQKELENRAECYLDIDPKLVQPAISRYGR